ncbi:MAG: ABC transporter substrate-binding protein [Acidobacteriota bacterium]
MPRAPSSVRLSRNPRRVVLTDIARREWLLHLLVLTAAGCRRSTHPTDARRNTLIVALSESFPRPLCPDYSGERLVFLPLVTRNEKGDRQGCLATSWEHSADYGEWTYRLRPDVRWHDGVPLTIDDIAFTLDLHSRPGNPYSPLPAAESVTVHDRSTFSIRGRGWTNNESDEKVSILPKHLLQHHDVRQFYEWDFWLRPVGSGPYRYLRHVPDTMVELEANPDYYKGRAPIERAVLKFTGQAGLTELLSENVDAINSTNPALLAKLASDPRFRVFTQPSDTRSWAIRWQTTHPLFRDANVRRALGLAINRRELLQVLNLLPQFPLADGVYTAGQFRRREPREPQYDPAEANQLLDRAGWRHRTRDGLRVRDGVVFRFTALTIAEPGWDETALYVQDQFRDLGVQMDIQPFERGAALARRRSGDFEAIMSLFVHRNLAFDDLRYQNAQVAALQELARTTMDPDVRDRAYRGISDILRIDQPITILIPDSGTHVVHRRVQGLDARWRANPLLFSEDLWLDDRAQQ